MILARLELGRSSGLVDPLHDAAWIVMVVGDDLDLAHVERAAAERGLSTQWLVARAMVPRDRRA